MKICLAILAVALLASTFAPTPELLFATLSAGRWQILRALAGRAPTAVPELARILEREGGSVQADVTALLEAAVLRADDEGRVSFPFDEIRFRLDVPLRAA